MFKYTVKNTEILNDINMIKYLNFVFAFSHLGGINQDKKIATFKYVTFQF